MKSVYALPYSFAIRVIAFASRVCASCLGEVAGLDLDCGGGLRDMNFGDGGM